jgi:hypothetical protein
MLGLVRNGAVLVQRSKSYVKPENKVLPIEFPQRALRQTNLLKTEGMKRTWRNHNKTTSNSTIMIAGSRLDLNEAQVKPSLIKTLMNQSTPSCCPSRVNNGKGGGEGGYEKNKSSMSVMRKACVRVGSSAAADHDATSNDELTDFDDNLASMPRHIKMKHREEKDDDDADGDDEDGCWNYGAKSNTNNMSSSVDNLKNVRNEIRNYREKYSRSMGNIVDNDCWHFEDEENREKVRDTIINSNIYQWSLL